MSNRTILFVLSSYSLGGAERQLALMLEHRPPSTAGLDLQTITFLPPRSREVVDRFERTGVKNTLVDRSQHTFPAFFLELVRSMARIKPAIVHTRLDSSVGAWGRLAAWLTRVPVIIQSDLDLPDDGTRAHLFLRPYLDRVTTRFLPNAESIAQRLERSGVPRGKIVVMPNGLDLSLFDPERSSNLRPAWGVPEDAVVAGFLGRFAQQKRVDVLLDALLAMPPDTRPDRVVLGGDGPTMGMVRERVAADAWLSERCLVLGETHDVSGFMNSIDYLVLSSDHEGLPNVVLEAMAMRKPVVGTRVSDVPLVVEPIGFLADPGDPPGLGEAIGRMQALTREERRALGDRARAMVERDFDLEHVARWFWDAHTELLPQPVPAVSAPSAATE